MTGAVPDPASDAESRERLVLWLIGGLTVLRLIVLILSPLNLYPDEAQYWFWAQAPDFGYFSKPPLIAWIIWLTTHLLGESEWAVRAASPLLHGGTAVLLYHIGRRCGGARLGFWSALAYATMPGVSYSASLISTDVPLLFCSALALYALLSGMDAPEDWRWAALCGAAVGIGLEAKYAMLYFFASAAIGGLAVPALRRYLFSPQGAVILALSGLLILPNLLWNAAHHFPTIAHIAVNADWDNPRFGLKGLLSFAAGQFGVAGPFLMAGFLVMLWRLAWGAERDARMTILACFAATPLSVILVQSFIAGANANWAAASYVPATPLAVSVLLEAPWALIASFVLDGAVMLLFWIVLIHPKTADALGAGNALKRQTGWQPIGLAVMAVAQSGDYQRVAIQNRSLIAEMTYYTRYRPLHPRAISAQGRVTDHFDMAVPLHAGAGRLLVALLPEEIDSLRPVFESLDEVGRIDVPLGGHRRRVVVLFEAKGFHPAHAPH